MAKKTAKRPAPLRARGPSQRSESRGVQVDTSLADILFNLSPRFLQGIVSPDKFYQLNVWLYAGIGAICRNITGVPFEIRTGPRNSKKSSTVESGPWVDLFDQPNPMLTRSQFWEAILVYLNLPGGECFVIKEGRTGALTSPDEIPTDLWPQPGALFRPDEFKNCVPAVWKFRPPGGEELVFKPWQLIHLKGFNPLNPLRGLGPGDVGEGAIRRTLKRDAYNEVFFDNDATPSGAFVSDGIVTAPQKEQFYKKLEDDHKGPEKKHRTMILGGGMKFVQMGSTHKDMAFQEQGIWDRDEVLATLGVPKSEVGLEQDVNMVTGAGTLSKNRGFWIGKLVPTMNLIEETFWPSLFKPVGGGIQWGAFNKRGIEALRGDRKILLEQAQILRDLGYSQNQINEYLDLDLPKTDIGDIAFVPSNLTPIDSLMGGDDAPAEDLPPDPSGAVEPEPDPETPDPKKPPAEEEAAPTPITLLIQENERTLLRARELAGNDADLTELEKGHLMRDVRNFFRARSPKKDAYWQKVLKRSILPAEPKFAQRTRRYFMELRAEQLKRVKKLTLEPKRWATLCDMIMHASPVQSDDQDAVLLGIFDDFESVVMGQKGLGGTRDSVEEVLFPRDEWDKRMKSLHHPLYVDIVANATDQAFVELGGNWSFDTTDPKVTNIISQREEILVQANGTIRKLMAREIEEGVKNGETIQQIQERIRVRFNGFSARRSLTIARTEVAGATNGARHETFKGEGVTETEWVTARDEAVRESHAAQDGETRPIGVAFSNGLTFPGEPGAPPGECINCRCVASPVQ